MSEPSKKQYLESCRARYPSRNRIGKGRMIDEVSDTMGWDRKHTIKALNGKVHLGNNANKRGRKPTYTQEAKDIIVSIWKMSEQPCGKRLKTTLPLWLTSYEKHYDKLTRATRKNILQCSPRQLDRITRPHRFDVQGRHWRKTGRHSHRLKQSIPIRCGPWDVDQPGWMECDTVAQGGGSSSGLFLNILTMTDIHTGWTELQSMLGMSAGALCQSVRAIEERMPFELLGFDSDNGSEFLNATLESYLFNRKRKVKWTRSRAYKKNDQAHVEQKNFTHVRQLLGYERYEEPELKELVNNLFVEAWLPLRNYFTPVMKLIKKQRIGTKLKKTYDKPKAPCDRLLDCPKVLKKVKQQLRAARSKLDPIELSYEIERRLKEILVIVEKQAAEHAEEIQWERENGLSDDEEETAATEISNSISPPVANAPCDSIALKISKNLAKTS